MIGLPCNGAYITSSSLTGTAYPYVLTLIVELAVEAEDRSNAKALVVEAEDQSDAKTSIAKDVD